MKRLLHALAALWALRTGPCGFADSPICEFAKSQPSESAHLRISESAQKDSPNNDLPNGIRLGEPLPIAQVLARMCRGTGPCGSADLPIREFAKSQPSESVHLRISKSAVKSELASKSASATKPFATAVAILLAVFMCLLAALKAPAQSGAAVSMDDIQWTTTPSADSEWSVQGLNVGANIPDMLWNTPLTLWNAADGRTETITLNDYRGKVIILDFWATWCKSCISNMPRMHQLQHQFEGDVVVLPVTYEQTEAVAALFTRAKSNTITQLRNSFESILADSLLKGVFPNPNGTIPYFALIGNDGLYRGPITPDYLTESLIEELIAGGAAGVPHLRATPVQPLMDWSSFNGDRWQPPVGYHGMLSRYMHGAGEPTGREADSLKGAEWLYYINQPLLRLFGLALGSPLPRQANRRIMLVDSAVRFDDHSVRNPEYERFVYNYCYESTYPIGTPKDAVKARMLADLNALTGVKGQLVSTPVPCLVIQRNPEIKNIEAPAEDEVIWRDIETVVWALNSRYDLVVPPVIDETDFAGDVWMNESARRGSLADARKVLEAQGFKLKEEVRELEMFLLTDRDDEILLSDIPLSLTRYGYVKKGGGHE